MKSLTSLVIAAILCSSLVFSQDYDKAHQLFESGKYSEAAKEYEKIIPSLKKEFGKTDTTYVPYYNFLLGASYFYAGDAINAEKVLQENVSYCQKNCPKVNQNELDSHEYLATIYSQQGKYQEVINERQKVVDLQIKRNPKKEGLINLTFAYNDLGLAYYTSARDKEAIEAFKKALDYFDQSGSTRKFEMGLININMSLSQLYLGQLDIAKNSYQKGFQAIYEVYPKDYYAITTTFRTEGKTLINNREFKLAQEALKIDAEVKSQVIGSLDTSLVETYIYLGQAYYHDQQPIEAKNAFDKISPIIDKAYSKDPSNRSFWYNYTAGMYELIGEKTTALAYYEESLPYYESMKNSSYGYIITLKTITKLATEMGQFDKALEYALIKYDFFEKGYSKSNSSAYADYMNGVFDAAIAYMGLLKMNEAEQMLQKAYEKDPKLSSTHPDLHVNLQDKFLEIYSNTGRIREAHDLLAKELIFLEKNYGKNDFYYITKMGGALLYSQEGEHLKALEILDEIYPPFKGRKDFNEANILNNVGFINNDLGNYARAEKKYFEALKIIQAIDTNNIHYVAALGNLGKLYFEQQEYDKSLNYYLQSKLICEQVAGKSSKEYVTIVNSIANDYLYSSRFEKAVDFYNESLKYIYQVYPENHPVVLDLLGNIGHAQCALRFYEDGINTLEDVYQRSTKSMGASSLTTLLFKTNLAIAYHSANKPTEAKRETLELLQHIDNNVDNNLKFMKESSSLALLKKMEPYYSGIQSYLFDVSSDKDIVESCFNSTLSNKGKLLVSNTALKNQINNSKNSKLISTYEQWTEKIQTLSKLHNSTENVDLKLIDLLQEEADQLEESLIKMSSAFATKLNKNYDWREIQKKIKNNEAIVEFVRIDYQKQFLQETPRYGAFILTKEMSSPIFVKVCDEQVLKELLGEVSANNLSYVQKVYGKGNEKSKLQDLLITPLEPYLKNKSKVYFSPDGLLHKVSFSAISNGSQYLGDRFQIQMINSGAVLLEEANNTIDKIEPLLIGGVEYNIEKVDQEVWKYLAGTKTEISGIEELLKPGNSKTLLLTGQDATEMNFNTAVASANLIHIATHGFFYPEPSLAEQLIIQETEQVDDLSFRGGSRGAGYNNYVTNNDPMMRSGIALSGANRVWNDPNIPIDQDGVLTALDFSLMDLHNIELIVLSACETGLGDVKGSEGVYGLQRSLKLAGAKRIIMSLWQVPDKETKEFMLHFYEELMKSKNIEEAFVNTQRSMSSKYDPYYWGAFILL